jgi:RND superfamily putative drug exporter
MSPFPAVRRRSRPATSGRFATALRRLRWPVVIVWVLAVVLLDPLAGSLPKVTDDSASAYLPSSAPSTRVVLLQGAARHDRPESSQATVVFARDSGLTSADLAAVASAHAAVGRLAGRVGGLGAPGQPRRSADGRAEEFTSDITTPARSPADVATPAVRAIRRAAGESATHGRDGLRVAVTGPAAVAADSGVGNTAPLLLTALAIVALILLLVYRSPVLWLLPLAGAVAAREVAKAAAHGLATAGLTVSSLSTSILSVLVLGAASDYALLLIHRYREELRHHATTEDAMAAALRRTSPTLAASAATIVAGLLCLLAAESTSLRGLGPVGAVGIISALLAEITLLPALLLVFGRAAFWPRIPREGEPGHETSRLWSDIGARIARRPVRITVASVLLLGAACAGLATLHTDNDPMAELKGHPGSVVGERLLAEHFPAGDIAPLVLLAPPGEANPAAAAARATPGVATVTPDAPAGRYAGYSVSLAVPPYGARGAAVVPSLRGRLARDAPGSLVGGGPAVQYDTARAAHRDALVLIPLVLVVILVIIALLLRAIVAPLVLVITTALSFAASFGLSSLLWRYALGFSGIEAQLPLYIFVFLVALGVDYNIFLSARIREETRSSGTRQGVLRGLGVTGGVITAAGVVLGGTFAALAQLPSASIAEVGTAVALGVLLDTLLVRTVLVPASLLAIGERAWWPARPWGDAAAVAVRER